MTDRDWRLDAACAGNGELWFSTDRDDRRYALHVCRNRCPVRGQCLTDTLAAEAAAPDSTRYGIAGGYEPAQRDQIDGRRARRPSNNPNGRPPSTENWCGTPAGRDVHRRRHEPVCDDCKAARRAAS